MRTITLTRRGRLLLRTLPLFVVLAVGLQTATSRSGDTPRRAAAAAAATPPATPRPTPAPSRTPSRSATPTPTPRATPRPTPRATAGYSGDGTLAMAPGA